jgi:hypothetical protein
LAKATRGGVADAPPDRQVRVLFLLRSTPTAAAGEPAASAAPAQAD